MNMESNTKKNIAHYTITDKGNNQAGSKNTLRTRRNTAGDNQ